MYGRPTLASIRPEMDSVKDSMMMGELAPKPMAEEGDRFIMIYL